MRSVSAVRARVGGIGECGGEETVGPLLGVAAGVGEDEVDFGVAHFEPGELVGDPAAVCVLELVEGRVAAFDDDGGERELCEPLQLEGERAVGERGGEALQVLALDGGERRLSQCLEMSLDGSGLYRLLRVEPGRGVEPPARSNAATPRPPNTAT